MESDTVLAYIKNQLILLWDLIKFFLIATLYFTQRFFRLFISRPLKSVKGEIILLTGAGNGIGREIAIQLAPLGATIVCWDNEGEANDKIVKELKNRGARAFGYTIDITDKELVKTTAAKVRAEVGEVSVIFNNAGICPNGLFLEQRDEDLVKTFEVNLFSHFWILRQFLPSMIEKGKGHIVTTASLSSFCPCKDIVPYASSKHGVHGFIDSLRQEMKSLPNCPDIKFTTLYPIFVRTRMMSGITLVPRHDNLIYNTPEFVAKTAVDGFRRNIDHIYVPGETYIFALLATLLPFYLVNVLNQGVFKVDVEREKEKIYYNKINYSQIENSQQANGNGHTTNKKSN